MSYHQSLNLSAYTDESNHWYSRSSQVPRNDRDGQNMPAHSTIRQSPHGVQTPYRYHRLAFLPEQPRGKAPQVFLNSHQISNQILKHPKEQLLDGAYSLLEWDVFISPDSVRVNQRGISHPRWYPFFFSSPLSFLRISYIFYHFFSIEIFGLIL